MLIFALSCGGVLLAGRPAGSKRSISFSISLKTCSFSLFRVGGSFWLAGWLARKGQFPFDFLSCGWWECPMHLDDRLGEFWLVGMAIIPGAQNRSSLHQYFNILGRRWYHFFLRFNTSVPKSQDPFSQTPNLNFGRPTAQKQASGRLIFHTQKWTCLKVRIEKALRKRPILRDSRRRVFKAKFQ